MASGSGSETDISDDEISIQAINNILDRMKFDTAFSVAPLKIICCDGQVHNSFSNATCETILYHDWLAYKKSVGPEESISLPLSQKDYLSIVDFLLKKKKAEVELSSERKKGKSKHDEQRKMSTINVFRFISLFDVKKIRRLLQLNMSEKEDDHWQLKAINKLKNFFRHEDINKRKIASNATHPGSEYTWTQLLAVHLLEPLADGNVKVDCSMHEKKDGKCPCKCAKTVKYGDTSMGDPSVWHGTVDVLVGHQVLVSTDEIPAAEIPESEVEVKLLGGKRKGRSEFLAETIVFGHCRKNEGPPSLVPNTVISTKDVKVFMYDFQHDILLESQSVALIDENGKLSGPAIIMIWLSINWKHFCSGITQSIYNLQFFSDFRLYMKERDVLPIYEGMGGLFGGVGKKTSANYYFKDDKDLDDIDMRYKFLPLDQEVPLQDQSGGVQKKSISPPLKRQKRDNRGAKKLKTEKDA